MRNRRLLSVLAAALLGLVTGLAVSHAVPAPPPPPIPCTGDGDCPACLRCVQGFCDRSGQSGLGDCMCDAECAAKGLGACDLSPATPLCAGRCKAGPPAGLTCGTGHDVVRVEPFIGMTGQIAGARVSCAHVVVRVERPL